MPKSSRQASTGLRPNASSCWNSSSGRSSCPPPATRRPSRWPNSSCRRERPPRPAPQLPRTANPQQRPALRSPQPAHRPQLPRQKPPTKAGQRQPPVPPTPPKAPRQPARARRPRQGARTGPPRAPRPSWDCRWRCPRSIPDCPPAATMTRNRHPASRHPQGRFRGVGHRHPYQPGQRHAPDRPRGRP